MSKYSEYGKSTLVELEDETYLVQGDTSDELTMFRPIDELFEFERDSVQKMLGEVEQK